MPPHRVVGEKARLICKFDMEGDILYSVKWYKDDLEFYRFVPNDRPKLQVFPQEGIHVDVSISLLFSNIINVSYGFMFVKILVFYFRKLLKSQFLILEMIWKKLQIMADIRL